ncbi:hypothetical protein EYF80_026701 [Liparis tanakae]|uniref:Uncharacterized protein n=1 Tax=Liparis tanakae TaxID=230148 RepID=A0A4Z2HCT8_9TELE|nr:hypothetical protein EYF80_026701 [Liparis tanakae]
MSLPTREACEGFINSWVPYRDGPTPFISIQEGQEAELPWTFLRCVSESRGSAAAGRVGGHAAILALVLGSGVGNREHGAIGTRLHIVYKEHKGNMSWIGWAPLGTWHLKLADPPWRTVADRGSTETSGAWPATTQREISARPDVHLQSGLY